MSTYIGQQSDEVIAEWKKKHGNVSAIIIDGHIAYFKNPDRKALSYASAAGQKDPIKFNEVIMNHCFIGGSSEVKDNDAYFLSASGKIAELIDIKEAELVKL